jgi:hypothetical protein
MPILAGVIAKVDPSVAMTMSHEQQRSQAPPQTVPSTIAMTGTGQSWIWRRSVSSGSP